MEIALKGYSSKHAASETIRSLLGLGLIMAKETESGAPSFVPTMRGYFILLQGHHGGPTIWRVVGAASKAHPFFTFLRELEKHGFNERTIETIFLDPIRKALSDTINVGVADERLLLAGLDHVIIDHIKVLKARKRLLKEIASLGEFVYGTFTCMERYDIGDKVGLSPACLETIKPYYATTGEQVTSEYYENEGRVTNVRMKRFADFLFELVPVTYSGENSDIYIQQKGDAKSDSRRTSL